jgi:hypothetical protein
MGSGNRPELLVDEITCPPGLDQPRGMRVFRDEPGRITVIITELDVEEGLSVGLVVDEWVAVLQDRFPDDVARLIRHRPEYPVSYQEAQVSDTEVNWLPLDEAPLLARYSLGDVNPHSLTKTELTTRETLKLALFDRWRYGRLRPDPQTNRWVRHSEREQGIVDGAISALAAALVADQKGYCPDPVRLPFVDEDVLTLTADLLVAAQTEFGWREQDQGHLITYGPPSKTERAEFGDQVAPGTYSQRGHGRHRARSSPTGETPR